MLNELARAAAYSASASFGRDAYRGLRNRGGLALFIAGVFLTAFGFRHMVMGHNRGWFATLFLTIIGSLLMIIIGLIFVLIPLLILWTYYLQDMHNGMVIVITIFLTYLILSTAGGLNWGFRNRAARQLAVAVELHNVSFLDDHGFQDLGLGEGLIEDGEGHRLRLRETDEQQNRLVFSVVGRRNVRAAIQLDAQGRMLSYTGAIAL